MHTDEYGISLSRELDVCRKAVRKADTILSELENKYHLSTEAFIAASAGVPRQVDKDDAVLWHESYEAREIWRDKLKQYEELLGRMKM